MEEIGGTGACSAMGVGDEVARGGVSSDSVRLPALETPELAVVLALGWGAGSREVLARGVAQLRRKGRPCSMPPWRR